MKIGSSLNHIIVRCDASRHNYVIVVIRFRPGGVATAWDTGNKLSFYYELGLYSKTAGGCVGNGEFWDIVSQNLEDLKGNIP